MSDINRADDDKLPESSRNRVAKQKPDEAKPVEGVLAEEELSKVSGGQAVHQLRKKY